jgi:hypothetical protein
MSQTLLKLAADFTTTLTSAVAVGATTATLTSATDSDGVALPTGTYGLTIDRKNSSKEYIKCTLTSTALTNIYSVSRQGALTSGFARSHRKGAEVIISDFAAIKKINDVLDGTTDLDSSTPLKYDGNPTLTADAHIATKKYADDLAIAGSPKATEAVYGITKLSVAAVSSVAPIAVGDNDTRVPTQGENDALVGNNTDIAVGSGNKVVTQTGLQDAAEIYAASATGNDTYVITLSPVPTALHNGMTIRFKPDTANTGAATLNVNSLGALSIVTGLSTALATGDILANQVCEVVYNSTGTVWQLVNPASAILLPQVFASGTTTKDVSEVSGTQNIAHGLGKIPKMARIKNFYFTGGASSGDLNTYISDTFYNGTTQSSMSLVNSGGVIPGTIVTTFTLQTGSGAKQDGVVTFDSTNIIITWTKTGSPTGTFTLLWEAQA